MKSIGAAIALSLLSAPAFALDVPVDLSGWTAQGAGQWNVEAGDNAVRQTLNEPEIGVFFGPGNAQGTRLSATVQHYTPYIDDDFLGFVLGFKSGDIAAPSTNFLLIDWKQTTQVSGGCTGLQGLAISRVTGGLSNRDAAWCHLPSEGVTELARAATLGSTGWVDGTVYRFDIEFTASAVRVLVDEIEQFNITGTFSNGAFGFYNLSQQRVRYAGITTATLPPAVPEPATWAMLIIGFGLVGVQLRARKGRRLPA